MNYFKADQKFLTGLEGLRGRTMILTYDSSDGSTKELSGVLCKSKKGQFMISLGTIEDPELKPFNINRVMKLWIDGKEYLPKGE